MLQHGTPDDYVIATGKTTSVKEFLNFTFEYAGLDVSKHLVIERSLFRPHDVPYLLGDPTKARRVLDWSPKIEVRELSRMMFDSDFALLKEERGG